MLHTGLQEYQLLNENLNLTTNVVIKVTFYLKCPSFSVTIVPKIRYPPVKDNKSNKQNTPTLPKGKKKPHTQKTKKPPKACLRKTFLHIKVNRNFTMYLNRGNACPKHDT